MYDHPGHTVTLTSTGFLWAVSYGKLKIQKSGNPFSLALSHYLVWDYNNKCKYQGSVFFLQNHLWSYKKSLKGEI